MISRFDKERHSFESYLIKEFNYSKKASKDCASRCKRIETYISKNLSKSVSNNNEFEILLVKIQHYAISISTEKKSTYAITGTLRVAAKKYALYLYPQRAKKYPTGYGKSQYIEKF